MFVLHIDDLYQLIKIINYSGMNYSMMATQEFANYYALSSGIELGKLVEELGNEWKEYTRDEMLLACTEVRYNSKEQYFYSSDGEITTMEDVVSTMRGEYGGFEVIEINKDKFLVRIAVENEYNEFYRK